MDDSFFCIWAMVISVVIAYSIHADRICTRLSAKQRKHRDCDLEKSARVDLRTGYALFVATPVQLFFLQWDDSLLISVFFVIFALFPLLFLWNTMRGLNHSMKEYAAIVGTT